MPRDAQYIATYDVTEDRERERVARLLEGYGFRVQYSVFELRLTRRLREELLASLNALEIQSGHIYVYRRDPSAKRFQVGKCPDRPYDEVRHAFVL